MAALIGASGFAPVRVCGLDQSIRIEVGGDLHEFGKLGQLVTKRKRGLSSTGRGSRRRIEGKLVMNDVISAFSSGRCAVLGLMGMAAGARQAGHGAIARLKAARPGRSNRLARCRSAAITSSLSATSPVPRSTPSPSSPATCTSQTDVELGNFHNFEGRDLLRGLDTKLAALLGTTQ